MSIFINNFISMSMVYVYVYAYGGTVAERTRDKVSHSHVTTFPFAFTGYSQPMHSLLNRIASYNAVRCQPNPHLASGHVPGFHFPAISASTKRCKLGSNFMFFETSISRQRFARPNLVSPGFKSRDKHCANVREA